VKNYSLALATAALAAAVLAGSTTAQNGAAELSAEDYLDIRALIDQYPHILDNCVGNGYRYADLFTDDGTFGVSSEWGKAKIWFRGREQLANVGGGTTGCRPAPPKPSYHLNINPAITPAPGGAKAVSTLLTITNVTDARGVVVHWEGGYEDTFEKTAAGWRFKSRVHVWPEIEWTDRPEDMPPRNLADE
jgi:hypothetical protein